MPKSQARDALDALVGDLKAVASPLRAFLLKLHERYKDLRDGSPADYIPELSKVNPDSFGLCVTTIDGQTFGVGDFEHPFTIQSISKAFVFGQALEDHGREYILSRVGVEPTGDPFNSMTRLEHYGGKPFNPMINAGAIAISGQIKGEGSGEKFNRILDTFSRHAGRRLSVDMSVFTSERATGHRNRAMAHFLLNYGILREPVEEALDLYFKQCAVLVTCKDLSVMGATLANQGVNPLTKQRAIDASYIQDLLSVMHSCGMYDYSGEWAYRVGMAAKSGVGGGICAVVPGVAGIASFSPRLDTRGNSLRGVKALSDLSAEFGLHVFSADPTHQSFRDAIHSRLR